MTLLAILIKLIAKDLLYLKFPSMLWYCWLGSKKGIRPVKNRVVGCWHGYLSGARCRLACSSWCHCHSLSLVSVKFRLVLPFWYWLTLVVPEKRSLNGCVCVCCVVLHFFWLVNASFCCVRFRFFLYLAKRLAWGNVSEMTYFVSSGTWNHNSINQLLRFHWVTAVLAGIGHRVVKMYDNQHLAKPQ